MGIAPRYIYVCECRQTVNCVMVYVYFSVWNALLSMLLSHSDAFSSTSWHFIFVFLTLVCIAREHIPFFYSEMCAVASVRNKRTFYRKIYSTALGVWEIETYIYIYMCVYYFRSKFHRKHWCFIVISTINMYKYVHIYLSSIWIEKIQKEINWYRYTFDFMEMLIKYNSRPLLFHSLCQKCSIRNWLVKFVENSSKTTKQTKEKERKSEEGARPTFRSAFFPPNKRCAYWIEFAN